MVCPYLKNKGSAVRFCLWPPINIGVFKSIYLPVRKEKINKINKTPVPIKEADILPFQ